MIYRINTRANGGQLADYVSTRKDNDHVEILEVDGREDADKDYLKQVIVSMELNAALTKCKNPYLNVQINPAYGEDQKMTRADWYRAADVLAEELGYQNQRRVIVLHTKKGRTHAHVVWERYNHETQKVIPTNNSRLKAKFARARIEKELGHKPTAWRNDKKPEIKETLTKLWNNTKDGAEFIKQAKKAGFIVASGTGNRPFMVVNEDGVSFDLVRQLTDIKTKEVRARLRHEQLVTDKQAIEIVRDAQAASSGKREREQPQAKPTTAQKKETFSDNAGQVTQESSERKTQKERIERFNEFYQQGQDFVNDTRKPERTPEETAFDFADNKATVLNEEQQEAQRLRDNIEQAQEQIRLRRQLKKRGR